MLPKAAAVAMMLLLLTLASGCIKNDIPYPRIQASIADLVTDNQVQPASIDSINRTVTLFLDESADIRNVSISGFTLTPEGAEWPDSIKFFKGVDLTEPVRTFVSLYQDYFWTISAVQTIERYFSVEGQVGAATIDAEGRRVVVYVPEHMKLSKIKVTSMKLGGPAATYTPSLIDKVTDFSGPVEVTVSEHGRTSQWTIYVQPTESTVTLERVDAWTKVAWLYVSAQEGRDNGIQYRLPDDLTWTELDRSEITASGGALTGRLIHLMPETTYIARAYSDDEFSNEVEFTTGPTYSIPNGSMDNWWQNGKVWNPWAEGGEAYWDTGNKGAATLGQSNTYPTDDTSTGTGQAACLETRFVGIGTIGKLAAGNLFAGYYVKTDGTNGILSFGRAFTLHPTHLKGYLKYKCCPVTHAAAGFENRKDTPDIGIVWCALIASESPFEIRTNPNNRNLFDPDAPDVVAYGKVEYDYTIENYIPFSVEFVYKDTQRNPTYIIMVASASSLGDYFTGGAGSTMWIDDLSLDFDY